MKHAIVSLFICLSFAAAFGQEPKIAKEQKDPVCGMKVTQKAPYSSTHKEKEHKFCSKSCKEKFDANPEKYVKK